MLGQQELFLLRKCSKHARYSKMGSFKDRKAYARLILFYQIVYGLVAILIPQYITQPHQIYTSSSDTAITINVHFNH